MSGSISATTAMIIAAGVSAAGVGASVYEGQKASGNQQAALKQQTQATQTAEGNALSTERKNATAENMANQQTPDISSIMAKAAQAAKSGIGSTMLTGANGAGTGTLGGSTLLGK
jgi:uncharacterized protein HemX